MFNMLYLVGFYLTTRHDPMPDVRVGFGLRFYKKKYWLVDVGIFGWYDLVELGIAGDIDLGLLLLLRELCILCKRSTRLAP